MFGKKETWKIVYVSTVMHNGARGVAFVEAEDRQQAMYTFMQQYKGHFFTVESCTKLF